MDENINEKKYDLTVDNLEQDKKELKKLLDERGGEAYED
jgi:hypothetical protein